jgi:hypothetical protein
MENLGYRLSPYPVDVINVVEPFVILRFISYLSLRGPVNNTKYTRFYLKLGGLVSVQTGDAVLHNLLRLVAARPTGRTWVETISSPRVSGRTNEKMPIKVFTFR